MKERATGILAFILILNILACTGCSKTEQGQKDRFDPASDYQYQYYQPDNSLGGNLTEDEKGSIYYLAGCYVYKYAPQTKRNAPLCNKTNCLHDRETDPEKMKLCNAYYPFMNDDSLGSVIAYEDGYIYIAGEDDTLCTDLIRIKTDGSERSEIHKFSRGFIYQIFHRGYYYYTDQFYDEDNKATFAVKAYPLNGRGKEKTVFTPSRKKQTYEISEYMAYGNHLYFDVSYTNNAGTTSENRYYSMNISTGETRDIKTSSSNETIYQLNFFNGKMVYYTQNDDDNARYNKKFYDGSGRTFDVPVYLANLDGSDPKKIPVNMQAGGRIYSDGKYLVISNDNLMSVADNDVDKKKLKKAEYHVYDKDYKLVDTYTERFKGYNAFVPEYRLYYEPLGIGDVSYCVLRNNDTGTAELYGGNKSQIGKINGVQFKRIKLATIGPSPAVKQCMKK